MSSKRDTVDSDLSEISARAALGVLAVCEMSFILCEDEKQTSDGWCSVWHHDKRNARGDMWKYAVISR